MPEWPTQHPELTLERFTEPTKSKQDLVEMCAEAEMWHYLEPPLLPPFTMDPPPEASKEEPGFSEVRHHPNPLDDSSRPLVVMDLPGFVDIDDSSKVVHDHLSIFPVAEYECEYMSPSSVCIILPAPDWAAYHQRHGRSSHDGIGAVVYDRSRLSRSHHKSTFRLWKFVHDLIDLTEGRGYLMQDDDLFACGDQKRISERWHHQVAKVGTELRRIADEFVESYEARCARFSRGCDISSLGVILSGAFCGALATCGFWVSSDSRACPLGGVVCGAFNDALVSNDFRAKKWMQDRGKASCKIQGDPLNGYDGNVNYDTVFLPDSSEYFQSVHTGPADTIMGLHRDPVSNVKDWLIFAVRELSRVAAGKAGSQEAVWGSEFKPAWWDSECALKWRNPTANPKDDKDTLNMKFGCLVRHLRKEGQLPKEIEEEVSLWEADHKSKVFLMSYLSSALGQASKLHSLVEDACRRMEKPGNTVDSSILNDLESCLSACVSKVESMKVIVNERIQTVDVTTPVTRGGNKRVSPKPASDVPPKPPCKRLKRSVVSPSSLTSSSAKSPCFATSSSSSHSINLFSHVPDPPTKDDSPKVLLMVQQQPLPKQVTNTLDAAPPVCQNSKSQKLQHSETRAETSKKAKERKRTRVKKKESENGVAAATDTVGGNDDGSSLPLSLCPPASVRDQLASDVNMEFKDFLELDLQGNDGDFQLLNDSQFLDNLLQEITPETSKEVTTATISTTTCPGPVSHSVPSQSPCSIGNSSVHTETLFFPSHDPLISQPFCSEIPESLLTTSFPFHFDDSSFLVADGQAENTRTEGVVGIAGLGGVSGSLQETGEVHDSGYSSESPVATSHQSSLDCADSSSSDLDNSDLEAFLNSLIV